MTDHASPWGYASAVRRVLVAACVALVLPAAAFAHGGDESEHGYSSTITRIVDGRDIQASVENDGHFDLTAPRGRVVIVQGYEHEPYVKFANGNVYVNESSPTTYINEDEPAPARASASATPNWVLQEEGLSYEWHDHRTHWMADEPPAAVRVEPDTKHHVSDWTVDGTVDGKPFAVEGSLDWAPTKSGPGYQWISYLAIGGFLFYALFAVVSGRLKKARRAAA
jgi:hypothetical protein